MTTAPAALFETLASGGLSAPTLGLAYLALLSNVVVSVLCYAAARALLVVSPNPAARDYGLYACALIVVTFVAAMLERRLGSLASSSLPYAAAPHLLALLAIHLRIYYRPEPRTVTLGLSSLAGAVVVGFAIGAARGLAASQWIALALACVLLARLWFASVSTKRSFFEARSIYAATKESSRARVAQKPWLGLNQWLALVSASLVLALIDALLHGNAVTRVPAVQVLGEASLLLGITSLVCSIPATTYWLARRNWMPELTRIVWLVWLLVAFALVYGNVLTILSRT
jgi:hypothetical protein